MELLKVLGVFSNNRVVYSVSNIVPTLGYIAFGVIDRGTNVLQVRPTTICPLNCIFCSVDAGPYSKHRWAEYIVDPKTVIETIRYAIIYKGGGIEALIDTIGDPLTYPWLIDLVKELKRIPGVSSVALETHGALLTESMALKLEKAGLDRINLSIDTLDPKKAKYLQGVQWFDVSRVKRVVEFIVKETRIDVHITPLWIPGVNDNDVIEVVKWAIKIGAGKRWPPVSIQKYNVHKYGRKVPGVKPLSWRKFWDKISELEKQLGIRLRWSMEEWGMRYTKRIPIPYNRGDRIAVKVIGRGWLKGEYIGVPIEKEKRIIALSRFKGRIGDTVLAEIIDNKDGLFIGRVLSKY